VAWVEDAAGVRNIRVARGPGYQALQVTRFTADDGQEIGEIAWNPDGTRLFFTRGDGPNARGEVPNPSSDPAGKRQEIWEAGISIAPARLADGHSPATSPDGHTAVWVANGQVWSSSIDGDGARPAQLIHARGTASGLVWSPDGSRLAFVSNRGDHAFIAVYDTRAKSLRFLDPSVDTDRSLVWSPDGTQIAFLRIPVSGEFEFGPKRTGQPWSIRVADAQSGQGHEIWRALEGRGSVFWPMTAESQLLWMAGDRLVFPWERDGWLHLYSIPVKARGPAPVLLTPGAFEIEQVASAPDRKSVVFSSNQDDADRRHLWRVSLDGRAPERLTSGTGIEWSPAVLNDGRIALFHADARMPARAALLSSGAVTDLDPSTVPAAFPNAALVEPQPVSFTAADGLRLHGQLFLPPGGGGKHAAVVFFHGGSRRQMLLGWHYMLYYNQAYGFNQYLASRGYVVLSVNYRSGIGYGSDFREAPHFGATGASEFNDVLGAGAYLRGRPDVDAARVGVWGGSYGGYLTALALARASDKFAAGVDLHGVHDWNLEVTGSAPARDREKRQASERLAFESSPLASIATWKSPVLLIQGDDDRNVAFAQTVQLAEALRKQGVPFEQLIFPDEIHDFLVHADWLAAYHAADEFLARYLKP
jgi:dipeptidyl aminopeptidase/acylaminoacyl peptidase